LSYRQEISDFLAKGETFQGGSAERHSGMISSFIVGDSGMGMALALVALVDLTPNKSVERIETSCEAARSWWWHSSA
jgi:hypothetical protein